MGSPYVTIDTPRGIAIQGYQAPKFRVRLCCDYCKANHVGGYAWEIPLEAGEKIISETACPACGSKNYTVQ